jgi:hypothetical protein
MTMKQTEVSQEQFNAMIQDEKELAETRLSKMPGGFYNIRWFLSEVDDDGKEAPCAYIKYWYDGTITCPFTGKEIKQRDIPESFKLYKKDSVRRIYHASDVTCFHLSTKVTVRCYAIVYDEEGRYKYITCEHKVGRCPHKTVSPVFLCV